MICYLWVAVLFVWAGVIAAGVPPDSPVLSVVGFVSLGVAGGLYVHEQRRRWRRGG